MPPDPGDLFIVRLYDGMDNCWMDVSAPLPRAEADKLCGDKNEQRSPTSSREGSYDDIDYYKVFPADTQMLFRGDRP